MTTSRTFVSYVSQRKLTKQYIYFIRPLSPYSAKIFNNKLNNKPPFRSIFNCPFEKNRRF